MQEAGFATAVTPSFTAEDQELSLDKVPRGLKHFMLPARELPSRRAHGKQKSEWSSEAAVVAAAFFPSSVKKARTDHGACGLPNRRVARLRAAPRSSRRHGLRAAMKKLRIVILRLGTS